MAGCTPDVPKEPVPLQQPAGWPAELDGFSIAWTAEPGIDLTTDGAAIAARAYVESYYLASITEDAKYLYPGFEDAVEPNQPSLGAPLGTTELHPELGSAEPAVWVGTARHNVLSITPTTSDVTVAACAYLYGSALKVPTGDGYTANVGPDSDPSGVFPMRIGLRAPPSTKPGSPAQEGQSKAPYVDVFGGWKITSFLFDYLTQPASGRRKMPTGRRASPRPTRRPRTGNSSRG